MNPFDRSPGVLLLELDLTQPMIEVEPEDALGKLRNRARPRLADVLRALHEAGRDRRVGGLVARVGQAAMEVAIAEEIRDAVGEFVASGKPAVAWAETFGEGGSGTVPYFLASGFSEIWLQPTGEVGLIGVSAEVTFLRGLLDKIGVEPQIDQRYEFKNAADRMMRTEFTEPHRLSMDRMTESVWDTLVAKIAAGRRLTPDRVRELADAAPLSPGDARDAGLIDTVGYRDEVYASVRRRLGEDTRLLFATRWSAKTSLPKRAATAVTRRNRPGLALVEAHGAIVMGRNRRSPMDGPQVGSDTLSAALRAAREDDQVRGVVFRVDSPGGSAVASDTVWREVCLLRDAGKPVVVSMGAVAGSGGYFIACPADVIVAQPTTITGSIGVFGGKAVVSDLMDKVGLGSGFVSRGARARMYTTRDGFTDDQRAKLAEQLDAIYLDFTTKVATGRALTQPQVHEIAKGRIWSGADALEIGLVDRLGGLRLATSIARERAGLPADAKLRPAVQVPMAARLRSPKSSDDPRALAAANVGGWSSWGDLTGLAAALGLPAAGPLMMPSIRLG